MRHQILKTLVIIFITILAALSFYFIIEFYRLISTPQIFDNITINEPVNEPDNNKKSEINITDDNNNDNIELPIAKLIESVPFTAQAPFGDWDDVKQDHGCEEASMLMAMYWAQNKPLSLEKARDEIIVISEFELENYGHHHDYSIADSFKVLKAYFKYENAFVEYDIVIMDIKKEIAKGNLVIIPINGKEVTNPYYTAPGPPQHQILVIGYDDKTEELIVHDPGTVRGEAFHYAYKEIERALMDYNTGLNEPIEEPRTAMLVIKPQ